MLQSNVVAKELNALAHEVDSTLDAAQEHVDFLRTTKVRDLTLGPHFDQLRSLNDQVKVTIKALVETGVSAAKTEPVKTDSTTPENQTNG